jgi:hypothetical protein
VTDLAPDQADILWYGLRSWIECCFKDIKRGGFNWHQTRMRDPQRVERLWLAIAVATIWLVSVGGQADAQLAASSLSPLTTSQNTPDTQSQQSLQTDEALSVQGALASQTTAREDTTPAKSVRHLSCFRRGFLGVLATILKGNPLPIGQLFPDFSVGPESVPVFASG